jgi:hypothetical protein
MSEKKPEHYREPSTEDLLVIERCISEFDFGKVMGVMLALEWGYNRGGVRVQPDIETLRNTARGVLIAAASNNVWTIHSTGGFRAQFWKDMPGAELQFILEESEAYGPNAEV